MKPAKRGSAVRQPTAAELEILRVLWKQGPSTVRAVQQSLDAERPTGYTTALKLLQIMAGKGLVIRDESERSHVYAPAFSEKDTQRSLVRDLLARAFGGSAESLVMQALESGEVSREELQRIRTLIDSQEERGHDAD